MSNNFYPGLTAEQRDKIISYYRTPDRGAGRSKVVKWSGRRGQYARFKTLNSIADLSNKRVLDVGCGLGDFFGYLQRTAGRVDYTGIDLLPEFILQAEEKYPGARFFNKELAEVRDKFDYVLSSGALSKKIPRHKEVYRQMIAQMYQLSSSATAFNMLDKHKHQDDEIYCAYDPEEILAFCSGFAKQAKLITGYLPHDFTIFLYH